MSAFIDYLLVGIATGCAFALLGTGFVAIHRVTRVVNFAQGAFAVLGGFFAAALLSRGLPHGLAEVLAVAACGVVGLLSGVVALGWGRVPVMASLVITLGLSIIAEGVTLLVWGGTPISYTGLGGPDLVILGAQLQRQYLLLIVVTLVVLAGLAAWFRWTNLGRALTACASNPYAARLMGIDLNRMGLLAFALGGMLGGLAGVLITPLIPMTYDGDVQLAINGFAAAICGGLVNPVGALVGGLVLGIGEQMVAGYWQASAETGVALVLLLGLLVWQALRERETMS